MLGCPLLLCEGLLLMGAGRTVLFSVGPEGRTWSSEWVEGGEGDSQTHTKNSWLLTPNFWNGRLRMQGAVPKRVIWPHFCFCGPPCSHACNLLQWEGYSIHFDCSFHPFEPPRLFLLPELLLHYFSFLGQFHQAHMQPPRCPCIMDTLLGLVGTWWWLKAWALEQDGHEIKSQVHYSWVTWPCVKGLSESVPSSAKQEVGNDTTCLDFLRHSMRFHRLQGNNLLSFFRNGYSPIWLIFFLFIQKLRD